MTNKTLIDKLFGAGAHFGFKKSRRHPSVKPYLYGTKQGNDIFDLEKSVELIENAKTVISDAAKAGKTVLFVGTKDEVSRIVKDQAQGISCPYVTNRWIGGMLTNFSEIKKRINRLQILEAEKASGEQERKYTKKERVLIGREYDKLVFNFGGIQTLEKNPDLMVIVDAKHDTIALQEANDRKIPVIGVVSSDNNISNITYPIVINDALQASVAVVLNELTTAYETGKSAAKASA
ncbi:30S ribosomal protein S2 [Candidatus Kaiserbacteria bacterium]|nr:30S ribosomal protein S2 [Candidatus Kaiserbacteria bacterium]